MESPKEEPSWLKKRPARVLTEAQREGLDRGRAKAIQMAREGKVAPKKETSMPKSPAPWTQKKLVKTMTAYIEAVLSRGEGAKAQELALSLVNRAIEGDMLAAKLILERVDGAVERKVKLSHEITQQVIRLTDAPKPREVTLEMTQEGSSELVFRDTPEPGKDE